LLHQARVKTALSLLGVSWMITLTQISTLMQR